MKREEAIISEVTRTNLNSWIARLPNLNCNTKSRPTFCFGTRPFQTEHGNSQSLSTVQTFTLPCIMSVRVVYGCTKMASPIFGSYCPFPLISGHHLQAQFGKRCVATAELTASYPIGIWRDGTKISSANFPLRNKLETHFHMKISNESKSISSISSSFYSDVPLLIFEAFQETLPQMLVRNHPPRTLDTQLTGDSNEMVRKSKKNH